MRTPIVMFVRYRDLIVRNWPMGLLLMAMSAIKAGSMYGMHSAVLGVTIAALAIAPVGVWLDGAVLLSKPVLITGFLVAVLSTAVPHTLEMIALPRLPTATFGTLMSLEPAFGALSGLLFLGYLCSIRILRRACRKSDYIIEYR